MSGKINSESSMAIFYQPENQCELFKMLIRALKIKIISILNLENRETEMYIFSCR